MSREKKVLKKNCEKKQCISAIIFPVIIACLIFMQFSQISKTTGIFRKIEDAIRSNICEDVVEEHGERFGLKDLNSKFNVKFSDKSVAQNEFVEKLLNGMNVTESERYQSDFYEFSRRENQYGQLIERGYANDERFYIKLSSPEVGYGLFANVDILPNTVIGVYHGVFTVVESGVTNTDYAWDYGTFPNPESPEEKVEICIDSRTFGNWLRFVNHKEDAKANCFAMYVPYNNRWYVVYMSRRFIPKDHELFASYGDNYWNARADSHNLEEDPEKAYTEEAQEN